MATYPTIKSIATNPEDDAWFKANGSKGSLLLSSPLPSQLKAWGLTRDQYKKLYSKAEADWKKNTGWFGKLVAGNNTNDVNQYLLKQMIESNGAYAVTSSVSSPVNTGALKTPTGPASTASYGGGGGGGLSYTPVEKLSYYTADDLAKRFGITNDYATILKELQDATTSKFNEMDTTMQRAESSALRGQESAYNQYLQDLRSRAANAVSSGATKGTSIANSLAALLSFQDSNREGSNTLNDLMYDMAQQRGTALSEDVSLARQQANEIGQYLGNLSTSMDTNAINLRAAELAANAQRYAAGVGASATTNAARIAAEANANKVLDAFIAQYGTQKGFQTYTDILNGK